MIAAIYGRVSTEHQDFARQVEELHAYVARQGWEAVEYLEKESAKGGSNRPVLARLLADAQAKKLDVVVVWKIDRFGRSLGEMVENVRRLDDAGVRFVVTEQGLDTDKRSPLSKMLMHILAVFAEFELSVMKDRTGGGLKEYMADYRKGRVGAGERRHSKSGRDLPVGRPRKIFRRDLAREMHARGMSFRAIAKELGRPATTVADAIGRGHDPKRCQHCQGSAVYRGPDQVRGMWAGVRRGRRLPAEVPGVQEARA